MNKALGMLVLIALTAIPPAQARDARPYAEGHAPAAMPAAALVGPIIYQISGITDDGGAFSVGIATSIHCTNFGKTVADVQVIVQNFTGTVDGNKSFAVLRAHTATFSTHLTTVYGDDVNMATGTINQGSAKIYSSSRNVHCSAQVLDAAGATPAFAVALHMVRFNPVAHTQE